MNPTALDTIVGRQLSASRASAGLSALQLANRVDLLELEVLAYERGQRRFSAAMLVRFARSLDCPVIQLLWDPGQDNDNRSRR